MSDLAQRLGLMWPEIEAEQHRLPEGIKKPLGAPRLCVDACADLAGVIAAWKAHEAR
jgi:hypothetical protein